ncbi:DUF4352 domain-containing protein [Amphibacillus sp. Q70]|uniref:DUF4352 domain-containing protein n=1 Tax=Amphibacillus sp. Q70 TaxID=3453416 RepID=UPI003F873E95
MLKKFKFLVLGIILVFGLAACDDTDANNNDEPAESEESNDTSDEIGDTENEDNLEDATDEVEGEEEEDLVVGDTVNFEGLEITLNEARIEPGGEFDTPGEDQFIVANLTIENKTDEEQVISSMLNIELKDEEGYAYMTTFLMEGTKGQLDGSLEVDETMRGEIPFDVPESDTYELHFSDPFKTGKAIWTISASELE